MSARSRPIDVVKVGGHELDDPDFVAGLARAVAAQRAAGRDIVVVHGGGRAIADLQAKLGLTVRVVDGLRVTNEAALDVAEMALSGLASKRLVAAFVAAGLDALGEWRRSRSAALPLGRASDGGPRPRRRGRGGSRRRAARDPRRRRAARPVAHLARAGRPGVNVNADTAAAAVAAAIGAARLVLLERARRPSGRRRRRAPRPGGRRGRRWRPGRSRAA
ncbi:MAG: hypothetical protein U0470_00865 [Anaerolineae bacterium]